MKWPRKIYRVRVIHTLAREGLASTEIPYLDARSNLELKISYSESNTRRNFCKFGT